MSEDELADADAAPWRAKIAALRAENERLREVVSMLVEELGDPCRVNFQKEVSAVWLSQPLRTKARAALSCEPTRSKE